MKLVLKFQPNGILGDGNHKMSAENKVFDITKYKAYRRAFYDALGTYYNTRCRSSIIDMKIKLLTILCFAILLTGCKNETVNGVTSIETTSTAGANSVSSISESETNVAEERTVEVSKEVSYEDTNAVDYSDIYITGFSADSEILCIEQDSFYKNFSAVIIENYIESDGNSSFDTISATWDEEIANTKAEIDALLSDDKKEAFNDMLESWDVFEENYLTYINSLYGVSGAVPGSMYKEMAPSLLETEYELMAGMLMSIDYQLGGNIYEGSISEKEISEVNMFDYSNNLLCLEDSDEFYEYIQEYEIDELDYASLSELLLEKMEGLEGLTDKKLDSKQLAEEYIDLVEKMNVLEKDIFYDESRCDEVRNNRIKILLLQVLNSEYLLTMH